MTTGAADSPPRIAEVRGRTLGVNVLAFFALAWVGWGTGGHLPTIPQVIIVVFAALWTVLPGIGAALVLYATCGVLLRQSALLAAHNESG